MKGLLPKIDSQDGEFHNGNPATGTLGTRVTAEWLNDVQAHLRDVGEELKYLLSQATLAPIPSKKTQVYEAIIAAINTQLSAFNPISRRDVNLDTQTSPIFFHSPVTSAKGLPTAGDFGGVVVGTNYDCTQLLMEAGKIWVRGSDNNPISSPDHWSDWNAVLTGNLKSDAINQNDSNKIATSKAVYDLNTNKADRIGDEIKMQTINYTHADGYTYSGFYRPNVSKLNNLDFANLLIHITHPEFSNNSHARGIGFNYGSLNGNAAWDLFTTAFDAGGNYLGRKRIMTELGGIFTGSISLNNNMLAYSVGGPSGSIEASNNIDGIWHDDNSNTFHFQSDSSYKTTGDTGNASLSAVNYFASGRVEIKSNSWERLRATLPDGGYWRWEVNPASATDPRFNFVYRFANGDNRYLAFPRLDKNETVAYQSWVNAQKVNKAGDTMTGKLIVPTLEVTSNNSGGNNIKIGDDVFLGDDRIAHTAKFKSTTDDTKGFVAFGNSAYRLGRGINYQDHGTLEWEGNYISLNARDGHYAGIDFSRTGNMGNFKMRLEPLPDKRWKFWTENSHEIFLPAQAGTVLLSEQLVGMPMAYPLATVPEGFLPMRGQAFDKSRYPILAQRYPSGRLPDLRGEFIRGWDNGRGVDGGRGLLSNQGDAIRNIRGDFNAVFNTYGAGNASPTGVFGIKKTYNPQVGASTSNQWGRNYDFDASRVVPTAHENRPRNIAFQYICLAG